MWGHCREGGRSSGVAIKRGSTVIRFSTEGMWNKSWSIEPKWTKQTNCLEYIKLRFLSTLGDTILKLLAPVPWSVICSTVSACVWVWVYYVYRDKGMWHALRVLAAFCARIQLCILCFGVTGGHWVVDKVCSRVFWGRWVLSMGIMIRGQFQDQQTWIMYHWYLDPSSLSLTYCMNCVKRHWQEFIMGVL